MHVFTHAAMQTGQGIPPHMTGLASGLMHYGSVAEFRAHMPMPKDAQEKVDTAVIEVAMERLTFAADVLNAGLIYSLPEWLGVPLLYWERLSKTGHAQRTMTPGTRGERQVAQRDGRYLPIYATFDDFSFGIREMEASRRANAPLDVGHVKQATRRVDESIEDSFIFGATDVQVDGNAVPGLLNAPNAGSFTYESNLPWDDPAKTGEDIIADVQSGFVTLEANNMFPPYNLYIPQTYSIHLGSDFKANSDKTIRQRLLELDEIASIKTVDRFPANRTALVKMSDEVIEAVVGQSPVVLSWFTDPSGWHREFVVLACIVPRFRDDYDGQSGVALGFPT